MRAPLRAGASTTTVASLKPLMIRLRRGKVPWLGWTSGGSSDTIAPPAAMMAAPAARAPAVRRPHVHRRSPRP